MLGWVFLSNEQMMLPEDAARPLRQVTMQAVCWPQQ